MNDDCCPAPRIKRFEMLSKEVIEASSSVSGRLLGSLEIAPLHQTRHGRAKVAQVSSRQGDSRKTSRSSCQHGIRTCLASGRQTSKGLASADAIEKVPCSLLSLLSSTWKFRLASLAFSSVIVLFPFVGIHRPCRSRCIVIR